MSKLQMQVLQATLDRRNERITELEKENVRLKARLNEFDDSIEFLYEGIEKNKIKIKNADFTVGTVWARLNALAIEISAWEHDINLLETVKSNMAMNEKRALSNG